MRKGKTRIRKELQNINAMTLKKENQEDKEKDSTAEDIRENLKLGSDILEKFNQEISSNEPVRELFSERNIKLKTQVTEEQRNIIAILYSAYMRCVIMGIDFSALKDVLDQFVIFGVPLDRKSREEFVDANKTQQQFPMMGMMGGNIGNSQQPMQQGNNLRV